MTSPDIAIDAAERRSTHGTLLESGRRGDRPVFTATMSAMLHAALVAAAVFATGEAPARARLTMAHASEHVTRVALARRPAEPRPRPAAVVARDAAVPSAAAPVAVAPSIRVSLNFSAPELPPVSQPAPILFEPITTSTPETTAGAGAIDGAYAEDDVDLHAELVGGQFTPPYPDTLRYDHPDGRVLVRFVIDSSGRVDARSIRIVMATHRAFAESVAATIAELRFVPAVRDGQRVRVRVEHEFDFHCAC